MEKYIEVCFSHPVYGRELKIHCTLLQHLNYKRTEEYTKFL